MRFSVCVIGVLSIAWSLGLGLYKSGSGIVVLQQMNQKLFETHWELLDTMMDWLGWQKSFMGFDDKGLNRVTEMKLYGEG
jgi:hypothetical protein